MGLKDARPYEMALLLNQFAKSENPEVAVVSLDFKYYAQPFEEGLLDPDWDESRLKVQKFNSLWSFRTLMDSFATLSSNFISEPVIHHLPTGQLNIEAYLDAIRRSDYRFSFDNIDRKQLNDASFYKPFFDAGSAFRRDGFDHSALRKILRTAREKDIRLYFFLPPDHVRHAEVLNILGLTPFVEKWKTEIVCVLYENAAKAGKPSYPLWDFSGYNQVTTEPVPPLGMLGTRMKFYNNSKHYHQRTGGIILSRMFDPEAQELNKFKGFGNLLTNGNIKDHILETRRQRKEFQRNRPRVSKDIATLYPGNGPAIDVNAEYSSSDGCGAPPTKER